MRKLNKTLNTPRGYKVPLDTIYRSPKIQKRAIHTYNFDEVTMKYGYPEGKEYLVKRNHAIKLNHADLGDPIDAEKTTYRLPIQIQQPQNLLVYVNGVYQKPSVYSLDGTNTFIIFNEPLGDSWYVQVTYTE